VGLDPEELDLPGLVHLPHAGTGCSGDVLHRVLGVLDDELTPGVDVLGSGPAGVQLLHVQLEVHVRPLQEVEEEEGGVGVGEGGQVRHGAGPGDPGFTSPR
jgi:hypothetical protein